MDQHHLVGVGADVGQRRAEVEDVERTEEHPDVAAGDDDGVGLGDRPPHGEAGGDHGVPVLGLVALVEVEVQLLHALHVARVHVAHDLQGVLDRHESMACNLGARPLGPILIKRFERLFDGPPRVLKSHGKDGTTVTWLDVVEFARNKPEQFQLGQMSEGVRVCQFYTKQCRVQISEEDFVLISSGIPQKMIPPQPIIEDEEKELGTIEILEKNLGQICQLADQGESQYEVTI